MSTVVSKTELARNTREIVDQVRSGDPVVVQSHGKDQVVLLDAFDYRLLHTLAKLSVLQGTAPADGTFDQILREYSRERISLAKAAELLGVSRYELMARFERLDIPIRTGPATLEEARADVLAALDE